MNGIKRTAVCPNRKRTRFRVGFYRQCRIWHGYLSAVAFVALIFFSLTGIFLNHPEWFAGEGAGPIERSLKIPNQSLVEALKQPDIPRVLAQSLAHLTKLRGAFQAGEIEDNRALIRMSGASGSSDITVNLETGEATIVIERAKLITIINELHRGTNSGRVWRVLIDVVAVLTLVISLIGYIIVFSLKVRLKNALLLTGFSMLLLVGLFVFFVP